MNKESINKKIRKKYGVSPEELQKLSLSKIKELRIYNKLERNINDKYKFLKKPLGTIVKGGTLGAGAAGALNTAFPNLVPVIGTALTEANVINPVAKTLSFAALASQPVDIISGPAIIGVGAAIGAVAYSGYSLVKTGVKNLSVINDRKKAKKLTLKAREK